MRLGLLAVLLVACIALFWMQPVAVVHPVQADRSVAGATSAADEETVTPVEIDGTDRPAVEVGKGESEVVPTDLMDLVTTAMHTMETSQPCLAGTVGIARLDKIAVHRWVDEAGIVHFSDQGPRDRAIRGYRRIEVEGLPAVQVHASGYDVNLPDQLAQRAVADTQAIARVLRDTLMVEGDPGLVLTIEFMGSPETYAKRVGNPAMANSDGTYSSADRTIRIRLQHDIESNFLILRHEITHALIHERVGRLPTAINEGLAGYLERIEVSGLGAQVSLAESRAGFQSAVVSTDGQEELVELLAREGPLFYASGREQRYLQSYALVAVLMSSAEGRNALSLVLNSQRKSPCTPVEVERLLDEHYPRGLVALAAEWSRWLRDPPRSVQAF